MNPFGSSGKGFLDGKYIRIQSSHDDGGNRGNPGTKLPSSPSRCNDSQISTHDMQKFRPKLFIRRFFHHYTLSENGGQKYVLAVILCLFPYHTPPIIFSGSQVMMPGKIEHSTNTTMMMRIKGITPRIMSPMVTPSSLGAVPFSTKIDMAIGGV